MNSWETKRIIIYSPSSLIRVSVGNLFSSLGVRTHQIVLCSTPEVAGHELDRQTPDVLVCDGDLDRGEATGLFRRLAAVLPQGRNSLTMLLTGNRSQVTIAKAASENIDLYVLKPFTPFEVKTAVLEAWASKEHPHQYLEVLTQGKKELAGAQQVESAMRTLEILRSVRESVSSVSSAPRGSSGTFVVGSWKPDHLGGAQVFNKVQYQFLVDLYEFLRRQGRYADAYKVVLRISSGFIFSPGRLSEVLKLAIQTRNYDDIERIHAIFQNADIRSEDMIKVICAALVIAGKFHLKHGDLRKASALFKKAAISAGNRVPLLREVVEALADAGKIAEAREFLNRFPFDSRKNQDFLAMEFLFLDKTAPAHLVLVRGWKLLSDEVRDPVVYRVMVQRLIEYGKWDSAEHLVHDATARWPDLKAKFKRYLPSTRVEATV